MNDIFGDLSAWLYWHGPNPEDVSQTLITISVAIFAIVTAGFLAPYFSVLNRKRRKKIKGKQKRWAVIRRRIANANWGLKSASDRQEIKEIIAETTRLTKWPALFLFLAYSLSAVFLIAAQDSTEETNANSKSAISIYVKQFDLSSKSLWQSTSPTVKQVLYCDEIPNELNSKANCDDHVPRKSRQQISELRCNWRASLYETEKWYEGYSEFDRLNGTIIAYKLCMLEDGWITTNCKEGQRKEDQCTKIDFRESMCLRSIRKWLDGTLDRRPCEDARNWWYPSRPEPKNRQW